MMDSLWKDIVYGLRLLRANATSAAVAILSLALGIGASVSMFSVVNAALLRPLPVASPDELVFLFNGTNEGPYGAFSYPRYVDYRDGGDAFSGLAAYGEIAVSFSDRESDGPRQLRGVIATDNFFDVLGLRPPLGRTFSPDDEASVVLSHELWQSRFGADPSIVGRDVVVNGRPYTAIGVLPSGFRGPDVLENYELYVPMAMQPHVRPPRASFSGEMDPDLLNRRTATWLRVIGRIAPAFSFDSAQAAMKTLAGQIAEAHPDTDGERTTTIFPVSKLDPRAWPYLRSVAWLLMGVAGLVLVVAAANVTSLLLARAVGRRREIAIRLALGGGRARLVRQLLTESLVLSFFAGAVGLLVASWCLHGLARLVPPTGIFSFTLDFDIDVQVLGFTTALSVVSALLVGIAPALRSSDTNLALAIRDPSAAVRSRGSRLRGRNALVVAQLALSLMLLVGAGLFLKSFWRSRATQPGFAVEEILTADLRVDLLRYTKVQGQQFYRNVIERLGALSSVRSASLAHVVPLAGGGRTTSLRLFGARDDDEPDAVGTNVIGLDFFRTMGITLLRGRDFATGDVEGAPFVVVVNASFAERYFPGEDAIGKQIQLGSSDSPWREIVGIVSDSKYRALGEPATPHVYQPLGQRHETGMVLVLRTSGEPDLVIPDVRRALLELEPNLPVSEIRPLRALIASALFPARMGARLLTVFAMLALVLAAVGLYGIVSFAVSQRTRELGIRVALGARPRELVRLVLEEGMFVIGAGFVFGLLGAAFVGRLLTGFLYEVGPTDPAAFAVVSFVLVSVTLVTTYFPARRAARSDPLVALRYE